MLERGPHRRLELRGFVDPRDPDARPEPRRLDEHRQSQCARTGEVHLPAHRRVAHLRDPDVGHQVLEQHLVHAQGRGEHAGADIRDVEGFEQPLERAVLAERAMQDWEHDVDARQPASRRERELVAVGPPHPVASDLDLDRLVPSLAQALADRRRGRERHLVLRGAAAAEDSDAQGAHVVVPVDVVVGGGVVVVVVVVGDLYLPTTIVTVLFFLAVLFGPGLCDSTTPFFVASVTVW